MILRKKITHGYTTIPQSITKDENLSLKDMGLLLKLLSLPDDWDFSLEGIGSILKKDKRESIRSGIKSLEEAGYIRREKVRNDKGQLVSVSWLVTDEPFSFNATSNTPMSENPMSDIHTQLNTNSTNNLNVLTPNISHGKSKSLPPVDKDSNEYALAKYLFDGIHTNFPNIRIKESDIDRWARDVEKIHRIDGYDWQTIADVTEFALTDQFWRENIRSGAKLREKFDTLLIRSSREKRNS